MCGICGKYNFDSETRVEQNLILKMLNSLNQRGPDQARAYLQANLGFGAAILNIRDPENATQPFFNENKQIFSVFNGEIYNYPQLRKFLEEKGHQLKTNCDAEIISHLYEEYGPEFVNQLNGMFSIALFDQSNNALLLARDRIGIKPLYYSLANGRITFASAVTALIIDLDISRELDSLGIDCYFSLNYFPGEYTPLKQIKKLLPGHYLIIRNNKVEINKYWQFKFFAQKARPEQEYVAEFQRIFKQVVKDQLVADVPVGGFLSGGLDSSGLCYNAYQENPVFKTFNVGFREKTFDEQKYLNRLGTSLRENCYCCELPEDMVPLINQVIDSLDMPVGEGSYLPLYFLSGFAKNKVTVALSGEGADELFGGYEMYLADICAKYYKKISQTLRIKLLKTVIRVLPVDYKWMNPRFSLELFLKGVSENQRIAHYFWREIFSQPEKQFVYNPDFLNSLSKESEADPAYHLFAEKFKSTNSKNFLEQAMFFDTAVCLPDGMLQRVDMSSMHNSLEVRVPYLDNRIVEFAQSLPLSMKIRNFQGKFLLKKAFKHNLAKQILQRRKHGMSAPVSKWLKTNLNEFSYAQFAKTNSPSAGIINQDYVLDMLKKHCQGEIDAGRKLWNLLIFSLWIDKIRS